MPSDKHSVAVAVRIRPGDSDASARAAAASFGFPTSVIEGSDQASVSAALLSEPIRRFVRGGTSCTLMAYGQTGSGKTYTMFGPPGSLTEASLEQASGAVPPSWGAFPRAMMELLWSPELAGATFHASAVEIYMEHAYDLLNGRKPVKVGSAKGAGRGNLVVADMGKAPVYSGDVVIVGGVHPSGCSCFNCFQKSGGLVGGARRKPPTAESAAEKKPGVPRLSKAVPPPSSKGAAPAEDDHFGTEGEATWPLRTPADVARLARLVESERVAHSHALNDRSSRSHCLIRVQCTHVDGGGGARRRRFLFVDLAGSERSMPIWGSNSRRADRRFEEEPHSTRGPPCRDSRQDGGGGRAPEGGGQHQPVADGARARSQGAARARRARVCRSGASNPRTRRPSQKPLVVLHALGRRLGTGASATRR